MNRMPSSLLVSKGLEIAEQHFGIQELAKRLRTVESVIRAWSVGHATMPEYKFLRLMDIVAGIDPQWTDEATQ